MKRKAMMKVAASSLIVGSTMVGCTGAAFKPSLTSAKATKTPDFAAAAEKAMAARNYAAAVTAAEAAVAEKPDSDANRMLLGRAYLASGRFASAETAFRDAMTLGNTDSRTVISLALIKVALGDSAGARSLLVNEMDRIPAADYGLAIAMAGDPTEGVRVLGEAIHDPSAVAKTRQNLAYVYALAGRWRESRMMAEQDVDPVVAAKRVLAWAESAQPGAEQQRVVAFMGVAPRGDDAGLPAQLALAPANPAVQVAEAAPAPVTAPSVDAPSATPAVQLAETTQAVAAPAVRAAPAAVRTVALTDAIPETEAKPAAVRMRTAAYIKPVVGNGSSAWVVQLGAYDSPAIAREKWDQMSRYNRTLGAFPVVNSTTTVDGRLFYRLAVSGFGDRSGADAMCRRLRANNGRCFVREGGVEVKQQQDRWAALRGKQFASR
jgi:Flp pilus assembly protein TadD